MAGKHTMNFIVSSCVLFSIVLLISACGSTKLVEIEKTSNFLNLSEEQLPVVQPKIEEIKTVVDEFNAAKEKFETEMEELRGSRMGGRGFGGPPPGGFGGGQGRRGGFGGGGPGGLRGKLDELSKKQVESQRQIKTLVEEIKAVLDEGQLKKFEKIKLPELKMPEAGGGRRGGRMGGGRGGGRGGGGGFPPF